MAERWVVNRSTGAVAKKKDGRGSREPERPMYIDRSGFVKPPPPHIAIKDRNRKDPFNVLWASDDDR